MWALLFFVYPKWPQQAFRTEGYCELRDMIWRISMHVTTFAFFSIECLEVKVFLPACLHGSVWNQLCCWQVSCLLISIKIWLASILIINTLTMLTIGHADRGRRAISKQNRQLPNATEHLRLRRYICLGAQSKLSNN